MDVSMNQKYNSENSGSQISGVLRSQGGFTLVEVLVSVFVLVVVVITIYIGVIYAEQQVLNNYRDRVATLLASGELELQHFYATKSNGFRLHSGKDVIIDNLPRNKKLYGRLSVELRKDTEFAAGGLYEFRYLTVTVRWQDPQTKKIRYITMREDYYQ